MTLVFVPDINGSIRQLRLLRCSLIPVVCGMMLCAILLIAVMLDYQAMKDHKRLLVQIQEENSAHQREFLRMAETIDDLGQEAGHLKQYYDGIKASLQRVGGDRHARLAGIGGADPGLFQSNFPKGKTRSQEELVRYMHRSLERLREEVHSTRVTAIEVAQFLRHSSVEKDQNPFLVLEGLDKLDKENIRKELRAAAIDLGLEGLNSMTNRLRDGGRRFS